jgi:tyrosinase
MKIAQFAQRSKNSNAQEEQSKFAMLFFTPHQDEEFIKSTAAASSQPIVRKNQSNLSDQEKQLFLEGIKILINTGSYGELVSFHADMSHNMHGNPMMERPEVGAQRFLSWHRAYIFELEQKIRAIYPSVTIPYWDWVKDQNIPEWLVNFRQTVTVDGIPRTVERSPGLDPGARTLPDLLDQNIVMEQNNYTSFTDAMEGWKRSQFRMHTDFHNRVHRWVGGIMTTLYSPTDVLFWLHHANIDRLWSTWQKDHPDLNPTLNGSDAIMDPWSYNETELRRTTDLNYVYE